MPARSDAPDMVKVWDWPLRAFHWALAFFVLLAWFTPSKFDNLHRFAFVHMSTFAENMDLAAAAGGSTLGHGAVALCLEADS